jgi:hypothetical protein
MAWWCVSWCSGNSSRLRNCKLTALKSQIRLCLRTWTYTKLFLGPCTSLDLVYVLNVNLKTDDVRAPVRRRTRAATWQNSDYNSHSLHTMNLKRAVWWILIRRGLCAYRFFICVLQQTPHETGKNLSIWAIIFTARPSPHPFKLISNYCCTLASLERNSRIHVDTREIIVCCVLHE